MNQRRLSGPSVFTGAPIDGAINVDSTIEVDNYHTQHPNTGWSGHQEIAEILSSSIGLQIEQLVRTASRGNNSIHKFFSFRQTYEESRLTTTT